MASKLNPPSTIVTRRKKRDLEATMNSLKKLLEPSRSRKKNIPRSISKKVSPKKTRSINRFKSYEHSSEDGEYYPDKLKRKDNMKKVVLKPKHELKVVVATNKRKRGTPHKGLKSLEEKHTMINNTSKEHESNSLPLSNKIRGTELPTQSSLNTKVSSPNRDFTRSPLSVQTSMKITKYELVSPPHRSLTELTVDDLMRMDEDSLSEDDFMEVLTCPSPVWWEDPPDYFDEGVLSLARTDDLNIQNEVIKETADKTSTIDPTSNNTDLKRTETVSETKKSKKMAKLENILGNIKNRVQNKPENNKRFTDKDVTNDTSKDGSVAKIKSNEISNFTNRTDNHDEMNHNLKETSEENELDNEKNENDVTEDRDGSIGEDHTKQRKTSTSGSDMSVNDEDLLRNLENIDIPIHMTDTDSTKDKNDKQNSKDNDGEPKAATIFQDLEIQTTNSSTNKEVGRPSTKNINSKGVVKTNKRKDILKRLKKQSDDILDVRLIKIPTNATNQVKVWSKMENFQRHNLKPEDFDEVIDIENELVFSMIKCNNKIDPETICIDDDDDEPMKDAMDLDAIGKANDKIDSNFTDLAEIILVNTDQEETITISKDLDVRPITVDDIETHVSVDVMTKPKQNSQAVIKQIAIESIPNIKQSYKKVRGIRILPANMIAKVPNSNTITNTNKKRNKTKNLIKQYEKEKTNGKMKGVKIINTKNDNIIRINDLDISIIKLNDHNVEQNKTHEVKNDLSVTLVKKDNKSDKEMYKRIEVPSKTPVILPPLKRIFKNSNRSVIETNKSLLKPATLPSLTKNPNNKESPKSINSISSETTDAEGTISDTNIQFLDEYDDDKRSVDIVFEGEIIDVENTDNGRKFKDSINIDTPAELCIEKEVDNYTEKISVSEKK